MYYTVLLLLSCVCALSHSSPANKPIVANGQPSLARWNQPDRWNKPARWNQPARSDEPARWKQPEHQKQAARWKQPDSKKKAARSKQPAGWNKPEDRQQKRWAGPSRRERSHPVPEPKKLGGDAKSQADKIAKIRADRVRDRLKASKTHADKTHADKIRADKIREDKIREDKIREDKIRADKIRADKIREDKIRADKIRADKIREDKIREEKIRADKIRVEKIRADKIRADASGRKKPNLPASIPALKEGKPNPVAQEKKNLPAQQIAASIAAAKKVNRPAEIHEGDAVIMHVPSAPAVDTNQEALDAMKQYLKQLSGLYKKQQVDAKSQDPKQSSGQGLDGREAADAGTLRHYYNYFQNLLNAQQYQGELQKAMASGEPYEDYVAAAYWRLLSDYYLGAFKKPLETRFTQGSFAASFHQLLEEDPQLKQIYYNQLFGRKV